VGCRVIFANLMYRAHRRASVSVCLVGVRRRASSICVCQYVSLFMNHVWSLLAAESQGRWDIAPTYSVLIYGLFSRLYAHELRGPLGYDTRGEPRQPFMRELMYAIQNRKEVMLSENLPQQNLFRHLVVGGNYGRSAWLHGTYENRPKMVSDDEYNVSVKRGALRHYYRFLSQRLQVDLPQPPRRILFLNRKVNVARYVANGNEILRELRQLLPQVSLLLLTYCLMACLCASASSSL
jgi:hypothetical protein